MRPLDGWRDRRARRRRERDPLYAIMQLAITLADHGVPPSTCTKCRQPIKLIGGIWTDPDGCINCTADLSAAYTPHEPEGT